MGEKGGGREEDEIQFVMGDNYDTLFVISVYNCKLIMFMVITIILSVNYCHKISNNINNLKYSC